MKATNTGVRKKVQKSLAEETEFPLKSPIVDVKKLATNSTPEARMSSDTPIKSDESFIEVFKELVTHLIGIVVWIKNVFTSRKYRKRAIKICRLICLVFNRKFLRKVVRKFVNIAKKLVKITTIVYLDEDTTTLSLEILPKT